MTPLLVLALAVAAPAPKDPPKKDPPGPIGRWALESVNLGGMPLPTTDRVITFTPDGRYVTRQPGGDVKVSGTFTADPKKDPAEIDTTEPPEVGGKVTPSIYRIEGDTLTVCSSLDGQRPRTFEAPAGSKVILMTFKRLKN